MSTSRKHDQKGKGNKTLNLNGKNSVKVIVAKKRMTRQNGGSKLKKRKPGSWDVEGTVKEAIGRSSEHRVGKENC